MNKTRNIDAFAMHVNLNLLFHDLYTSRRNPKFRPTDISFQIRLVPLQE